MTLSARPAVTVFDLPDSAQSRPHTLRAQALEAQTALLPYALGFFILGLVMFTWAASFAANAVWINASLAIFAINWGVFYGLANAVRKDPRIGGNIRRRTRVHLLGALLWAAAIGQISAFALGAGPARETLLILAAGGAGACYFFLAPLLPALLVVGPLAAAGPIIGLFLDPQSRHTGVMASGALALAMALSLVVNRILERQFALAIERDRLADAVAKSLAAAEKLAKSKSALLTTLGDEVRSGLSGVTHVLAAAAGGGRSPSREQLNAALGASRDLIEVLDATLDSEIAEDGRLVVRVAPIDAGRLVRDLVYLNQPQAAAKGLELAGHVEPDLADGAVSADPVRTRQILSNLIGNALRYTVRGRIEVRVRREGDGRVRFEIADTGPGLTKDEIEAAFTPFTRIERTSAGATGAGVGLSLSRKLAALMGGEVSAESALGVGSCFFLDLPFVAVAPGDAPIEGPSPVATDRALKVLVADDNQLNAAMTRAVLDELGHHVIQAQSPRRAAELLKICEVDLIVLGFGEPEIAAKAARLLRAAPGPAAQAPVLALIDGDADDAAARMTAGCSGVLRRPLTTASAARAIADLSQAAQAANAA